MNLVVADAAKRSADVTSYFGCLQKLSTLFSALTQRWSILKKHVSTTLKSWSDNRWESHINSVEAMRYQTAEVRDALMEVRDNATDPAIKSRHNLLLKRLDLTPSVLWHGMTP